MAWMTAGVMSSGLPGPIPATIILLIFAILLLESNPQSEGQHSSWIVKGELADGGVDSVVCLVEDIIESEAGFQ